MLLFDEMHRDYFGPARYSENPYAFYNRSASPAVAGIRSVLQAWLDEYPESHQADLKKKFQDTFGAAFFELFIHAWLLRHGARVNVHPSLVGTRGRPDFVALFPGRSPLLVEATVASDQCAEEAGREASAARLCDQLNELDSPNFFIAFRRIRNPEGRQPPGRRIRRFLGEAMKSLDPDEVTRRAEKRGGLDLPEFVFREGQLELTFSLIPKIREARGKPDIRPLGMLPFEARWGGSEGSIRRALRRKATKYGRLQIPFVIAVNVASKWGFSRRDVTSALFGSENLVVEHEESDAAVSRGRDGLWFGPSGPRNSRVSAVLSVGVGPSTIPRADLCIYFNPFAARSATGYPWRCTKAKVELNWHAAENASGVFDLPNDWPGPLIDREG